MGIAAPVFGAADDVIAGLSVVLLASRVPQDQVDAIAEDLTVSARTISEQVALLAG